MQVKAIYELPVPIWVTVDALHESFLSGIGPMSFQVNMPETPDARLLQSEDERHDAPLWTQVFGAEIPKQLQPAKALARVLITDVASPPDSFRSWRTSDHQLADSIDSWFDAFRSWVEVLTGQDLDPNHRVYDANPIGRGLVFIEPPHDNALGVTIQVPQVTPVDAKQLKQALQAVRRGDEPPLEEVLSRDARAAHRRGDYRRSTLDAATAIEIVLLRLLKREYEFLPPAQQKRLDKGPMLGTLVDIASASGVGLGVPYDKIKQLSQARNDVIHRGLAPDLWSALSLLQTEISFLGRHGLFKRALGEDEPSDDVRSDRPL